MSMKTKPRRTVFDLTPQDLFELKRLQNAIHASVPPRKPKRSDGYVSYVEYEYDLGMYERYREIHDSAKYQMTDLLRDLRITSAVAAQAALCRYNPYANAQALGLEAPPIPLGYQQAHDELFRPKPKTQRFDSDAGSSNIVSF